MAVQQSRRFEYIKVLLQSWTQLLGLEVTQQGLVLRLRIELAVHCHQITISATRPASLRTLTHMLPRITGDPVVIGFRHRTNGDTVTHTVTLAPEILDSAIRLQQELDNGQLVLRLYQLLADLQPIRELEYLPGRRRRPGAYNATYMIGVVRDHAAQWGFNPARLIQSYLAIGVQDSTVIERPLLPPPSPPQIPTEVLPERVAPPLLVPIDPPPPLPVPPLVLDVPLFPMDETALLTPDTLLEPHLPMMAAPNMIAAELLDRFCGQNDQPLTSWNQVLSVSLADSDDVDVAVDVDVIDDADKTEQKNSAIFLYRDQLEFEEQDDTWISISADVPNNDDDWFLF